MSDPEEHIRDYAEEMYSQWYDDNKSMIEQEFLEMYPDELNEFARDMWAKDYMDDYV